jgi:hypothetical protein
MRNREALVLVEQQMDKVEAFIFNSSTHWFAIRKLDNIWFNLNSTNPLPGPEIISDFYLSAFILATEKMGFTNFLVKNLPPLMDPSQYVNLQPYQKLATYDDVLKAREIRKEKEIKESRGDKDKKKEDEEDKNKFKAFTGKGYSMEDVGEKNNIAFEGDDEMRQAYEMSMEHYFETIVLPAEPEGNEEAFNIVLKYNDKTLTRKFSPNNTISV